MEKADSTSPPTSAASTASPTAEEALRSHEDGIEEVTNPLEGQRQQRPGRDSEDDVEQGFVIDDSGDATTQAVAISSTVDESHASAFTTNGGYQGDDVMDGTGTDENENVTVVAEATPLDEERFREALRNEIRNEIQNELLDNVVDAIDAVPMHNVHENGGDDANDDGANAESTSKEKSIRQRTVQVIKFVGFLLVVTVIGVLIWFVAINPPSSSSPSSEDNIELEASRGTPSPENNIKLDSSEGTQPETTIEPTDPPSSPPTFLTLVTDPEQKVDLMRNFLLNNLPSALINNTNTAYFEELQTAIGAKDTATESSIVNSAQYRALMWLALDDKYYNVSHDPVNDIVSFEYSMIFPPGNINNNEKVPSYQQVLERYGLAVLYYATGGDDLDQREYIHGGRLNVTATNILKNETSPYGLNDYPWFMNMDFLLPTHHICNWHDTCPKANGYGGCGVARCADYSNSENDTVGFSPEVLDLCEWFLVAVMVLWSNLWDNFIFSLLPSSP